MVGLAACFITGPSATALAQISVSPIDFTLDPGGPRIGSFTVVNDSPEPQQITLYPNDWDRDDNGSNRFYAFGSQPSSCKGRIQVFPQSLRLLPKANQMVRVALDPADSSRNACWTIIFAETAPAAVRGSAKLAFVTRIGVKVYVVSTAAGLDAVIDSMSVERHQGEPGRTVTDSAARDVVVVLHNTGGQPLTAEGSMEFRTLDNKVAARAAIDEVPLLPGAYRRIRTQIPALPSGQYVALAVLSYGGADDVAGQVEVTVP
jgi:P pilus assembly chaperone PapD